MKNKIILSNIFEIERLISLGDGKSLSDGIECFKNAVYNNIREKEGVIKSTSLYFRVKERAEERKTFNPKGY